MLGYQVQCQYIHLVELGKGLLITPRRIFSVTNAMMLSLRGSRRRTLGVRALQTQACSATCFGRTPTAISLDGARTIEAFPLPSGRISSGTSSPRTISTSSAAHIRFVGCVFNADLSAAFARPYRVVLTILHALPLLYGMSATNCKCFILEGAVKSLL